MATWPVGKTIVSVTHGNGIEWRASDGWVFTTDADFVYAEITPQTGSPTKAAVPWDDVDIVYYS